MQADDFLVCNRGGAGGYRGGDQEADAEGEHSQQVDEEQHDRQHEKGEPVLRDNLAARLHRLPELHAVVDDEEGGQHVADGQIDARQEKQRHAYGYEDAACQSGQEERQEVVEALEKVAELERLAAGKPERRDAVTGVERRSQGRKEQRAENPHFRTHGRRREDDKRKADEFADVFPEHLPALLHIV